MVTALLVGLVVGFVMVMPPGPIAMACMRQALAGQTREGLALVLGAAVMDSGYALLAAFASSALVGALWDMMMHTRLGTAGLSGGVYRGAGGGGPALLPVQHARGRRPCPARGAGPPARRRVPRAERGPPGPDEPGQPPFLPSLIFVMSLLQVRGWVGHAVGDHVMYALGFGGGAALWYVLLLRTVTHLRAQFSPTVMPMLARVAGGVLLLCAGLLTYTVVTTTAWSRLPGW